VGTPEKDRIYTPGAPKEFAGQFVVGTAYLDDPRVEKLEEVCFDPRVLQSLASNEVPNLSGQFEPV